MEGHRVCRQRHFRNDRYILQTRTQLIGSHLEILQTKLCPWEVSQRNASVQYPSYFFFRFKLVQLDAKENENLRQVYFT